MLEKSRKKVYFYKTVKRPWGKYTIVGSGVDFKIKIVEVSPKQSLSLQFHRKRSEHWVVVEGKAKVVKGKKISNLNVNDSVNIPLGCVHRLINSTNKVLKIVEVQVGSYLGEDDIVRLGDTFGRIDLKPRNLPRRSKI